MSGPSFAPAVLWARLNFGGENERWHAKINGAIWSLCKRQRFDYPRVEFSNSKPGTGMLCKFCMANLAAAELARRVVKGAA